MSVFYDKNFFSIAMLPKTILTILFSPTWACGSLLKLNCRPSIRFAGRGDHHILGCLYPPTKVSGKNARVMIFFIVLLCSWLFGYCYVYVLGIRKRKTKKISVKAEI